MKNKYFISQTDANIIKGVAIVFIVLHNLIHISNPLRHNEFSFFDSISYKFLENLLSWSDHIGIDILSYLGWYGIPVLLFLCGYGLVKKYESNNLEIVSFKEFFISHIGKLFKLILVPYMIFVLLKYIYYGQITSIEDVVYHLTFISNLWPENLHPGVYWFFGVLAQLYLCYYICFYRKSNLNIIVVNVLSVAVLLLCLDPDRQYIMNFIRHQCVGWILPFTSGILYARYNVNIIFKQWWKNLIMFAVCSILLVILGLNGYTWILTPLIAIALAIYLCDFIKKVKYISNFIGYFGTISAMLFVVHPVVRLMYLPNYDDYLGIILFLVYSIFFALLYRLIYVTYNIENSSNKMEEYNLYVYLKKCISFLVERIKNIKKETWIDLAKTYAFFFFFTLVLYIKCKVFLYLIEPEFSNPFTFDRCVSISLFIASFSLVIKNRIWPIVFCFIMDLWLISNMIYYNSCGFFIDIYALKMASNLGGFENSVLALWQNKFLWLFVPTIVLGIVVYFLKQKRRYFVTWILSAIFCYIFQCFGQYERWDYWVDADVIPDHIYNPFARGIFNSFNTLIQCTSGLHILFYDAYDLIYESFESKPTFSEEELDAVNNKLFSTNATEKKIDKLLIVIVESLENWGVNQYSMPNLWSLIEEKPNLHCTRIYQQTRQGVSSDGQMLVHTGMLPLREGVVSMLHPTTAFCSLFDCSPNSTIILPHPDYVWNQNYMNMSYGFKNKWMSLDWNDNEVFTQAIKHVEMGIDRISVITLSSHIPFTNYWDTSTNTLMTPEGMPTLMADYLRSLHHTDKLMAELLEKYKNDPKFSEYTLVITGDHTIFLEDQIAEYSKYLEINQLSIPKPEKCCPLLIFSPKISEDILVDEKCYQMDVFSTVKDLVGIKYYQYNGFGVNVMDSVALKNRPFTPEEALSLSDKIIKNNYIKEKKEEFDN